MNSIHKFQTDSFINALKAFFKELKVPVNYISDLPTSAKKILSSTFKENDTFQLIKDVYSIGIIDDAAFDGLKSIDTDKIKTDYDGVLVFGIELKQRDKELLPTRSQLAEIARAFNREFFYTPVVVVFKYGHHIAFANTERMQYKQEWREGEKVGKVTLLRDINTSNVHTGHLKILQNLEISRSGKNAVNDFKTLYKYWQDVLSVSILNKVFYKELSNWYFWAIKEVRFPNEPIQIDFDSLEKFDEALKEHKGKNVIRLLTRLLFIWFIKEKGLIPEEIFDEKEISSRFIEEFTPEKPEGIFADGKYSSKYYRAILQNLFFATLNQPRRERKFRTEGKHLNATQLMRYRSYLKEPEYFIELMESKVPFMNGGLFECLDKPHPTLKGTHGGDRIIYVDGFSDRPDNEVVVPDFLFFDKDEELDLSKEYGSAKSKKEKTRGLFNILKSYKFTITENTPIDEDVALDPELLGKVFENLLASYNPETKTTARKQTGSFYTPREIVNYMVEESLIAYLKNELIQTYAQVIENIDNELHQLVSFSEINPFENNESIQLQIIKALDKCKILDPACGSGAYPMGILQKMVHILNKIDPGNVIWKKVQEENAKKEASDAVVLENKKEREERLKEISDAFDQNINNPDYARKLFLIENCIYGVDIQPIATQISKLRFFISLVVDQKVDANKDNFGIRPLPNLETKFVAANTLIGLPNEIQGSLFDKREVKKLEEELKKVRHKLFSVKTPSVKRELRAKEKELREQMQVALAEQLGNETAQLLAKWDPYDQNTFSPFFDKEWMFDISEGFDVVIGNPPYIGQKGNNNIFKPVKESILGVKFHQRRMDYFYFFFHQALNLLKENGVVNFITTNYYITATYADLLRKDFKERASILQLVNFNELKIFESAAGQHNLITLLVKGKSNYPVKVISTDKKGNADSNILNNILSGEDRDSSYYIMPNQHIYEGNLNYIRLRNEHSKNLGIDNILEILKTNGKPLGDICEITTGIQSGAEKLTKKHKITYGIEGNDGEGIFILNNNEIAKLNLTDDENFYLKKYFKNSDIKKWITSDISNEYLIYYTSKTESKIGKNLLSHFEKYKPILVNRNTRSGTSIITNNTYDLFLKGEFDISYVMIASAFKRGIYYCVSYARNTVFFENPKIVAPQRSNTNCFGYNNASWYGGTDIHFIISRDKSLDLKYILALLNSKIYYYWLYHRGKRKGETLELVLAPLSEIPIKIAHTKTQDAFVSIADKILVDKKKDKDTSALEHQIDVMVYHLYELSYEEACVIDSGLSKEDFERFKIN